MAPSSQLKKTSSSAAACLQEDEATPSQPSWDHLTCTPPPPRQLGSPASFVMDPSFSDGTSSDGNYENFSHASGEAGEGGETTSPRPEESFAASAGAGVEAVDDKCATVDINVGSIGRPPWWKINKRAIIDVGEVNIRNNTARNDKQHLVGRSQSDNKDERTPSLRGVSTTNTSGSQPWWQFRRNIAQVESTPKSSNESASLFSVKTSSSAEGVQVYRQCGNTSLKSNNAEVKENSSESPPDKTQSRRSSLLLGASQHSESFRKVAPPAEADDELHRFLFPRRGRQSVIGYSSRNLRSSLVSQQSTQQSLRASISSHYSESTTTTLTTNNFNGETTLYNMQSESITQDVDGIADKMKLTSLERILLADIAKPNTNRWKSRASVDKGVSSSGSDSLSEHPINNNTTRGDQSQTKLSPKNARSTETNTLQPIYEGTSKCNITGSTTSISEQDLANNQVTAEKEDTPQDCPKDDRAKPDSGLRIDWDTNRLLQIMDGVNLSKAEELDDVSSISSSVHSGHLAATNPSSRSRQKSFRRWNSCRSISKQVSVTSVYSRDYDEDDNLEADIFASTDAKCERVVKEACELMNSVNRSVISMGLEPPFRQMDEIIPPFKKLQKNMRNQLIELGANLNVVEHRREERPRRLTKSKRRATNCVVRNSFVSASSLTSEASNNTATPSLDNHKAVAEYIISRMTMSQALSSSTTSESKLHSHTAFLPNYMWYQCVAADVSSIIKPTSLCSGTGIAAGGDQYLQPDMLNVFGMFGSYFVGAGHLFQDEEHETGRRAAFWMEPIHEGDDVSEDSSEASNDSFDSADSHEDYQVFRLSDQQADPQIEILEKVIEELRRIQTSASGQEAGKESASTKNRVHSKVNADYAMQDVE